MAVYNACRVTSLDHSSLCQKINLMLIWWAPSRCILQWNVANMLIKLCLIGSSWATTLLFDYHGLSKRTPALAPIYITFSKIQFMNIWSLAYLRAQILKFTVLFDVSFVRCRQLFTSSTTETATALVSQSISEVCFSAKCPTDESALEESGGADKTHIMISPQIQINIGVMLRIPTSWMKKKRFLLLIWIMRIWLIKPPIYTPRSPPPIFLSRPPFSTNQINLILNWPIK